MSHWIKGYYQQHARLEKIGLALKDSLTQTYSSPSKAMSGALNDQSYLRILSLIAELVALIRLHLLLEDHVLYPALTESKDQGIAKKANDFQAEMGGLSSVVLAFAGRWSSTNEILEHEKEFRNEAEAVLAALFDRLYRENKELYPLIYSVSDDKDGVAV